MIRVYTGYHWHDPGDLPLARVLELAFGETAAVCWGRDAPPADPGSVIEVQIGFDAFIHEGDVLVRSEGAVHHLRWSRWHDAWLMVNLPWWYVDHARLHHHTRVGGGAVDARLWTWGDETWAWIETAEHLFPPDARGHDVLQHLPHVVCFWHEDLVPYTAAEQLSLT